LVTARQLATAAGLGLLAFAVGLICGAYVQLVCDERAMERPTAA
jgi:hypothetical protein